MIRSQMLELRLPRRLVEIGLTAGANSPDQRYQAKANESAAKAGKLAAELGLKAKK